MSNDQLANLILAAATGIPAAVLLCIVVVGFAGCLFILFAWIIQPDRIAILKAPHDYGLDCWCGKIHPGRGHGPAVDKTRVFREGRTYIQPSRPWPEPGKQDAAR